MSALPVLLLVVASGAVGAAALAASGNLGAGGSRPGFAIAVDRATRSCVAGLVLLFALLLALDAAGVPWRRRSLAAGIALLFAGFAAAAAWRRRRGGARRDPTPATGAPFGWGDGVALVALAAFTWACLQRLVAIPDFVYHWGLKAERYHLAGGVDVAFLADPLRLTDHPDYPNLLPSLYAATAHLRGFFDERTLLLWSPLFLLLLVAGARTALARGGAATGRGSFPWLQAGTAAVALAGALFAIGYDLAGGGDLVIAAAIVVALPALLPAGGAAGRSAQEDSRRRRDDLRLGMAAALAAGAKIEGVPLALLLVALRSAADRGGAVAGGGWREALRRLPRLAGPPALLIAPWAVTCLRNGLFRASNGGDFDLRRLGEVGGAALGVFRTPEWHGLPWLLLLLPPLLLVRRLRPAAALLLAQAGFYLFVYLSAPVDTRFYVLSSLPRLLFHLLPAHLLLLTLAAARRHATTAMTAGHGQT